MNIVRMILKEAGGRFENAAGSINSKDNMFAGSSGNAVSDKLGGGGNNNPIENPDKDTTSETETIDTSTDVSTPETQTETADMQKEDVTFSDEKLKDTYNDYKNKYSDKQLSDMKGKLKNLDFSLTKPTTSNGSGGGGMGMMSNMFSGIMGASGSGAEGADMGADAGDMADAADTASDERLKNIFGDNEDAIKSFAKINAIEFTYNDEAHDIPGGEDKGIDDDVHYGVKAQELAENPLTESAVKKDPLSDYLTVDIKELTTANTAIISEICKRILMIEKVLGIKVV